MHECPIGGHQGVQRTYGRFKLYVTWLGMFQDVEDYIRNVGYVRKTNLRAHTLQHHFKKRILSINHGIKFI